MKIKILINYISGACHESMGKATSMLVTYAAYDMLKTKSAGDKFEMSEGSFGH